MRSEIQRAALMISCLAVLCACSSGGPALRVAQVCLGNKQDAVLFVEEMQAIAHEEEMNFVDGSAETARGLEIIGHEDRGRADGSSTVHVGIERPDGMGVVAGNMGLPGYQLAMGFFEGSSRTEATRFADKVIQRLGRYWRVTVLPAGSGVVADPNCKRQ